MPLRIIVVLVGAICTGVASAIYPYLGVLILLFLYFGRPQDDRTNIDALHIPMMMTISTILGVLLRLREMGPDIRNSLKRLRLVLLLGVLIVLSAINNYTDASSTGAQDFIALISFCVLSLTLVRTEQRFRTYLGVLLASGVYVMQRIVRNPRHMIEGIGNEKFVRVDLAGHMMFGNANYMALYAAMLMFLGLSVMAYYKSWRVRSLLMACVGLSGNCFLLANSRGASIALTAGLAAMWLTSKKKVKSLAFGIVLLATFISLAPSTYWDRLQTLGHYQEDSSATERIELWDIALKLIPEHPLLGVGFMNFTQHAFQSPHEAYLQIASEVGVPAMLVYAAMLCSAIYAGLRARRLAAPERNDSAFVFAASQGILACIVAVAVMGFTTGLAHREVVYGFVMLAFCALNLAELPKIPHAETVPEFAEVTA